ncbi:hypothetical protein, partial [Streptomyces rhizosphaerihabitans]|uniref:hypothetical protein n=1 Tax=Streptomyces rhizosphaerihabitans TaxID=1266770 RepID=UPI0021C0DD1E
AGQGRPGGNEADSHKGGLHFWTLQLLRQAIPLAVSVQLRCRSVSGPSGLIHGSPTTAGG